MSDTIELIIKLYNMEEKTSECYKKALQNGPISLEELKEKSGTAFIELNILLNGVDYGYYIESYDIIHYSLNSHFKPGIHGIHSKKPWSVFMPFSCSCGHAGCVGIFEGIQIKNRKHHVEWRMPDYKTMPKQFWSFEKQSYLENFANLQDKIHTIEKEIGRKIMIEVKPWDLDRVSAEDWEGVDEEDLLDENLDKEWISNEEDYLEGSMKARDISDILGE